MADEKRTRKKSRCTQKIHDVKICRDEVKERTGKEVKRTINKKLEIKRV